MLLLQRDFVLSDFCKVFRVVNIRKILILFFSKYIRNEYVLEIIPNVARAVLIYLKIEEFQTVCTVAIACSINYMKQHGLLTGSGTDIPRLN